jgi:hypothetical protein
MTIDVQAAIRAALGSSAGSLTGGAVRSAADGVLRAVGGFPVGDPAGMRAAAARLRDIALATRQEADHMNGAVERCRSWAGPARNRLATRVRDEVQETHDRATRLESSANALAAAAGRVEVAQHDWHSRLDHLSDDAIKRLRAVALPPG